jgi:hypothetical protein
METFQQRDRSCQSVPIRKTLSYTRSSPANVTGTSWKALKSTRPSCCVLIRIMPFWVVILCMPVSYVSVSHFHPVNSSHPFLIKISF